MNIVFMGTPDFSVPLLEALHERYTIKLVVTQPDMPKGRKRILTAPPIKEKAEALGLDVYQPASIKQAYQPILDASPDIIVTAAYGQIIPDVLLETPPHKAINVHASLLPALRGGAPIQRAIERRHKETGITIMRMAKKMDAGDILIQRTLTIREDETGSSLFNRLSHLAKDLLIDSLPKIIDGTLTPSPQNHEEATYAYTLKREEERLDFNQSVLDLDAKIRAFYETPNTYTTINGQKLKVIKARIHTCSNFLKNHAEEANGTVIKTLDDGVVIKCSDGALVLTRVQLAGKKPMTASEFMRGLGKRLLDKGVVLGN